MTDTEKLQAQVGALMALVTMLFNEEPSLRARLARSVPNLGDLLLSGPLTECQNAEFVRVMGEALKVTENDKGSSRKIGCVV